MCRKRRYFPKGMVMLAMAVAVFTGCGQDREGEGPVTFTYATFQLDFEMEQWIEQWNQSQENYRVEIVEYEDSDTGRARLNNEIVSGKGPDLYDLTGINVSSFVSKGLLTDLNPYLDREDRIRREELLSGVLETYEKDGCLYGIMPEFRLELLAGQRALTGDADGWTVDRFLEMTEGLSQEEILISDLAPMGMLRAVLETGMGDFVNWDQGVCSFDGETFRKLLSAAHSMETVSLTETELAEGLQNGTVLLNRIYVTDLTEYVNSVKAFGDQEISLLGFPSETGGKAVLTARMPVGISQTCQEKEGAWEFVSSLLGEEFQRTHVRFCLPVRLELLREGFERVMTENPYGDGPGSNTWEPATQEEIDALYDGLCRLRYSGIYDPVIWNIVAEEAEPYFEGEKTVDEVTDVIQRRASLYVSEHY